MRFKAKLLDINCMQQLTRVGASMSRMTKNCVLCLAPKKIVFVSNERISEGGTRIWCEIQQETLFDDYRIEGKDNSNRIFLELITDNFARALKSIQFGVVSVKIRLTKKYTPCLTIEIVTAYGNSNRIITHDVPVVIVPQRDWYEYEEPDMPQFDVSIYMPQMKVLKQVIDRMKNLSEHLVITADQKGNMTLKTQNDIVTVETHFKDLGNPVWANDAANNRKEASTQIGAMEACIYIKKLAQLLQGQQINPSKIICNLLAEKAIHIYLVSEDVILQYYIPAAM
ncbi:Checkpoint protein HUS1 [Trichoplax sp. H2]|nr:Checkpoint protein HUS1 [Trichoplax sp. H2]|eukprot:RDD45634.1 Checkpoint protein HUS1 [Trichoplax sp. H2]